ncbi:MAG: DUF5606 domain-containing protein [Porphyromonas sp.]|nr:DUF5606 domain-containing protein [Porphyromonas sp.]
MLKTILSISGKAGLFKLISQGRNSIIVESLVNGRRSAAYASDRVISLADISIYAEEGDIPLPKVLDDLAAEMKHQPVDEKDIQAKPEELFAFFGKILPTYDKERVYPTDIKKILKWYNLLLANGFEKFAEEETDESEISEPETDQGK